MKEVADIITNPTPHFDGPVDLAKSDQVDHETKHAALSNWQQHAEALDVATDEGMAPAPDESPLRPELEAAFGIVADKASDVKQSTAAPHALHSPSPAKDMTNMLNSDKKEKLAADVNQVGDDISQLARSAIESIRQVTEDFATKAGISRAEAVEAVRKSGQAAVSGLGSVAGEARHLTETGLDTLGKQVVRNPLAALAIAAGTGLILGLLSRSDTHK